MQAYEQHRLTELGFLNEMLSRGVPPENAEYIYKQAKYDMLGANDPELYKQSFYEELNKIAAEKRARKVTIIEDDDDPVVQQDDEDEEYDRSDIADKIKRWAKIIGIGGTGFLAGLAAPKIYGEVKDMGNRVNNVVHEGANAGT